MIEEYAHGLLAAAGWVVLMGVFYAALSRVRPCNKGYGLLPKGWKTDLAYYFLIPFLTRYVRIAVFSIVFGLLFFGYSDAELEQYLEQGNGPLRALPLWAQALLVMLLADVLLYWQHRIFHGRTLWRFHAIHHSSEEVDWSSAFRFHPINTWLGFTVVDAILFACGFSPLVFALLAPFNILYNGFVHANLNYTLGPLRYVLASPVFHRWHHTHSHEGGNCNFAATFPFLDLLFGTFYMPKDKLPQTYGVDDGSVPPGFVDQLLYPFRTHR